MVDAVSVIMGIPRKRNSNATTVNTVKHHVARFENVSFTETCTIQVNTAVSRITMIRTGMGTSWVISDMVHLHL